MARINLDIDTDLNEAGIKQLQEALDQIQQEHIETVATSKQLEQTMKGMYNTAETKAADGAVEDLRHTLMSLYGIIESKRDGPISGKFNEAALANVGRMVDSLGRDVQQLTRTELSAAGATGVLSGSLMGLAATLDKVADDADDASDEMRTLGLEAIAASINIGPFNFALHQMGTQIPILLTMFGGLTASIMSVAVAATAASVAFAGFFGGGMLLMAEEFAENNEDIENSLEAMQHVMQSFQGMFRDAISPLVNQQSLDMFIRFMEGLAGMVNMMARSMGRMQGRFSDFQERIGEIFFANFGDTVRAVERTLVDFMPILENLFEWFMVGLPRALEFFRKQGLRIMPTLGRFTNTLIDTFGAFSRFGITLFKGVMPVLGMFLNMLTELIHIVSSIPDGLLVNALKLGAFVLLIRQGLKFTEKLAGTIKVLISRVSRAGADFARLAARIKLASGEMGDLNEEMQEFIALSKSDEKEGGSETGTILALANAISLVWRWRSKLASLGAGAGLSGITGSLSGLSTSAGSLVTALSTLVAIVAAVVGFFWLFWDALSTGVERFGEITGFGSGFNDMMGVLSVSAGLATEVLGGVWDILTAIGQTLFNVMSIAIVNWFVNWARIIDFVLNDLMHMYLVVEAIEDAITGMTDSIGNLRGELRKFGRDVSNFVNQYPGMRRFEIGGAATEMGRSAEESMEEREPQVNFDGDYKPTNYNTDMSGSRYEMKPEEKARVQSLIESAVRDALDKQRRMDGG